MAIKTANKTAVNKRRNQVLKSVKNVNCLVVDLAEDIIDETLATGTKYQKLAVKAIKKSEPIIEKQVDMFFDTAELTIDQIQNNSKRIQKLLGITKQVNKASAKIGKIFKKVSESVEDGMEDVNEVAMATYNRTKKSSTKAIKAIKEVVDKNVDTLKAEANTKSVSKLTAKKIKPQVKRAKKIVNKATKAVKTNTPKSAAKAVKSATKKASKTIKSAKAKVSRAKKTVAKKATAKRTTAKKATAKRTAARKATAKRTTARKATAKKVVRRGRKTASKK